MTRVSTGPDHSKAADPKLVTLARAGDVDAFTELVRRRQDNVRRFMRYLSGHADDGDDLAQQVFLKAWQRLSRLRSTAAFDGWLRRIMVTTWMDEARKRKLDTTRDMDLEAVPARCETPGTGADLATALTSLSPASRLCVVLAYQHGLTHEEIATATGMPLGTVKSHVSRGAARLRGLLMAYGDSG